MKLKNKINPFTCCNFITLILTLMLFNFSASAAEYIYISDNLRVGVRTEPVSSVPPISVVFTGMRLEVQDRVEGYVKITTEKGITGWIKDIYVTKDAPSIIQLNRFKAKYKKLKEKLSQGTDTSAVLEKANIVLLEKLDEFKAQKREWQHDRASLIASQYKESSWHWIIWLFVLFIVGFAGGVFWHRTQTMKRLGGLRI